MLKMKKKVELYEVPSNAWTDLEIVNFSKAFKNFN